MWVRLGRTRHTSIRSAPQESDPNRSQQGRLAGVQDAQYADGRADEVGYPRTASICYVVSDGSRTNPSSGGNQIADYAAGIAGTSERPFFFYGNEYACDAAMQGAPTALGTWIPSTWGNGTLLTQEANQASPIDQTDLNTVHAPYGSWCDDVPEVPDLTPEQDATLNEILGWIKGGGPDNIPTIEARIELAVAAELDKQLKAQVHPDLNVVVTGQAKAAGHSMTLKGTAKP